MVHFLFRRYSKDAVDSKIAGYNGNVVTTLWQRYSERCDNVVTTLWQRCDNVIANGVTALLPKVVATLDLHCKNVTRESCRNLNL